MPQNLSRIRINAAAAQVWAAVTQPEYVQRWQFGSELHTDWTPGSTIRFSTPWEGQVFEQWGQVLEFEPHRSLAYRLFAPRPGLEDRPENYFTMRYRLTEEDGATLLEIVQEDERPGAVQEAPQGAENPVLQALKTVAEGL